MNPGPRSPPAKSLRSGVGDKTSTQITRYQEGGDKSPVKELQGARKEPGDFRLAENLEGFLGEACLGGLEGLKGLGSGRLQKRQYVEELQS